MCSRSCLKKESTHSQSRVSQGSGTHNWTWTWQKGVNKMETWAPAQEMGRSSRPGGDGENELASLFYPYDSYHWMFFQWKSTILGGTLGGGWKGERESNARWLKETSLQVVSTQWSLQSLCYKVVPEIYMMLLSNVTDKFLFLKKKAPRCPSFGIVSMLWLIHSSHE